LAQVKKAAVREAIIESAFRLFSARGYNRSTLTQIAAGANVSAANVYVYFRSKLDILFAIYDPWLRDRLTRLETDLGSVAEPRARLGAIFTTLWREIPAESSGFANNIMQALSSATPEEGYDPGLLRWCEATVARLIHDSLPPARRRRLDLAALSHVLFMAFDGYSMNHHLNDRAACSPATIELFCDLLLGDGIRRAGAAAGRVPSRRP
jgi:AcrR family transcriptional regulator